MAETKSAYLERKAALAALAAMHAARPLRPPPCAIRTAPMTAGAAELARELRRGTYARPRARLFGGEE